MRGTSVVASSTGGLAEFIRDGDTGLLIPPSDVASLAEALLSLVQDPKRADRVGMNGREFALRYLTEDVFVDRFLSLYESVRSAGIAPVKSESQP